MGHGFVIGGVAVMPTRQLYVRNYLAQPTPTRRTLAGAIQDLAQPTRRSLAGAIQSNDKLALRMGQDKRARRTRWVRAIVLHTTKGLWPQTVKTGSGPFKDVGEKVAAFWATSPASAGAHLVIDADGTVTCHCDLLTEAAYHAGIENEFSIGIEIFQEADGSIYEVQLQTVVSLCDELTEIFGIQRQMPEEVDCIARFKNPKVLARLVGIFGHRHFTTDRGRGDPGDAVFEALAMAGYERFWFTSGKDAEAWETRQNNLGVPRNHCDGVPGPATCDRLHEAGYAFGLWVQR